MACEADSHNIAFLQQSRCASGGLSFPFLPAASYLVARCASRGNWGISWNRRPCARPNLLLPSRRKASQLPAVRPHPLPPPGMAHPPAPLPGKRGASPEPTFRSSRMAHFSVPQGSRFGSRSGVGKLTEVYAWSMRPVFATAVPALCANSVNGMAAPPRSRARSASSCIRSRWVLPHCSGATGAAESTGAPACSSCDTNVSR